MNLYKSVSLPFFLFLLNTSSLSQEQFLFRDPSKNIDIRTQDLLKQLSLEEKISLLGYNSKAVPRLNIPAYNWWNEALHGVARAGKATVELILARLFLFQSDKSLK